MGAMLTEMKKLLANMLINWGFELRGIKPIAGAAEETPEEKAAREKAEAAKAKADEDALQDAGKRALAREREAREAAEKDAKEQKKRADALEAEKLSDEEKLKKQAADGERLAAEGTEKIRKANVLVALAEKGLKAKATYRLLDDVQFDASDQPNNLDDRIEAAKAEFGEDMFKVITPADDKKQETPEEKAARETKEREANPDLHAGPREAADEKEEEMIQNYLKGNFPGFATADA
jgi:hypothetical protein